MMDGRFIAVSKPNRAEGIGRALQVAFRDGFELPAEMRGYLDKLDHVAL
ncbi:hypothetical protein [Sphingomonas changbaiensis]|nr:hypothetical protein [Sphingomonas changbaiensis]